MYHNVVTPRLRHQLARQGSHFYSEVNLRSSQHGGLILEAKDSNISCSDQRLPVGHIPYSFSRCCGSSQNVQQRVVAAVLQKTTALWQPRYLGTTIFLKHMAKCQLLAIRWLTVQEPVRLLQCFNFDPACTCTQGKSCMEGNNSLYKLLYMLPNMYPCMQITTPLTLLW